MTAGPALTTSRWVHDACIAFGAWGMVVIVRESKMNSDDGDGGDGNGDGDEKEER